MRNCGGSVKCTTLVSLVRFPQSSVCFFVQVSDTIVCPPTSWIRYCIRYCVCMDDGEWVEGVGGIWLIPSRGKEQKQKPDQYAPLPPCLLFLFLFISSTLLSLSSVLFFVRKYSLVIKNTWSWDFKPTCEASCLCLLIIGFYCSMYFFITFLLHYLLLFCRSPADDRYKYSASV